MTDPVLDRTAETSAGPVRYTVVGEGAPLILVHGTPTSAFLWRHVVRELAPFHRVHVYDLPGYGQSAQFADQDVSIGMQGRVLAELVDHWGLDRPLIAGHDIGGTIVLRAHLIEGVDVAGLALLDTLGVRPRGGGRWGTGLSRHVRLNDFAAFAGLPDFAQRGILRDYIASAMHRPAAPEVLERYMAPWLGEQGRAAFYRQMRQLDECYTDELELRYAALDRPVRLIWGEEDTWLNRVDHAERLHAAIPGSELVYLPGAGHFTPEDAPGATARAMRGFFGTLPDGG
ncbi:Pimeloyl-ACP methyl ester carboxylesterase [Limimonas halophila]|uniref:Pimeloyl-ACP methyl ester carboxylesterase n=1 Tax=Limimonas halophila TaxID=1082479 RepID=A0A1G7TEF9_9PROT|nr:alpha/beta hydrolase [Limimonas halophila]SDG33502.1 Pimeloyl-ACP methyl ester carboxylesterase [Limimonas halophila]